MSPIERHDVPVLQFSGGKDSLACLTLLRPYWHKLIVVWANPGDAFPETLELMRRVRREVPKFIEIQGDAPKAIAEHGWPVDVLPTNHSFFGRLASGREPLLQPYTACCAAAIWWPMMEAMREIGATLIIRGQRNDDILKAPIRTGSFVYGIECWFPLEDWSEADVFAYLREQGVELPAHYAHTGSSLDCLHCTAYIEEKERTVRWMRDAYPEAHAEVTRRLRIIRDAAQREVALLNSVLTEG